MLNKIKFTCLIIIVLSILTACGSKTDEPEYIPKSYHMNTIKIPDEINATAVVITETAVYLLDDRGMVRIDYDGNVTEMFALPEAESFACLFIDEKGNFSTLAKNLGEDGKTITGLTVHSFNMGGATLGRTTLTPFAESESIPYPIDFMIADGYFYVQSFLGVYVYGKEGKLVYEVIGDEGILSKSLFVLDDGRVASASSQLFNNKSSFIIRVYNPASGDFKEHIINASGSVWDVIIKNGGTSGLLLSDSTGLFAFDMEEGRQDLLLTFQERGINTNDVMDFHKTRKEDIILVLKRDIVNAGEILIFTEREEQGTTERVDEADIIIKEKEIVTLAIPRFGNNEAWLNLYISAFNKSNPDYTIEVISYSEDNNSGTWSTFEENAIRRFNIDIGTGNIADITAFPARGVPIYSYTSKGIFADLYELMESDPDFNKENYLPNVLATLETDGRLYTIFPLFQLTTVIAKESDVGYVPGWTIDEFITFLDAQPDAEDIIFGIIRGNFIRGVSINYFADRVTGRMTFDGEVFLKILQAAERFPITHPVYPDDDSRLHPILNAKQGNPLMIGYSIWDSSFGGAFRDAQRYAYYFGEEITFIGFPTPDGSGSVFVPEARFAIAERSDKKEGAWQFIKFMMDTYIDSYLNRNLPIKISELERIAHEATLDFDNWIPRAIYSCDWYYGSITDPIRIISDRDNTPEENAKIWELLRTTNVVTPPDPVVLGIIDEEINAYIAGQKSAEVVMDIIENRINLYLSELE